MFVMKLPILLGALLLSAAPALAVNDMASERLKGYNYGYIYGLGNALCGLAIDKLIKKINTPKIYYLEQLRHFQKIQITSLIFLIYAMHMRA